MRRPRRHLHLGSWKGHKIGQVSHVRVQACSSGVTVMSYPQATFSVCSAHDLYNCDAARGPVSAAIRVLTLPGVGYLTKTMIAFSACLEGPALLITAQTAAEPSPTGAQAYPCGSKGI